jgi:UDP-N-acetylglucosamine--N-acetylmuramyl-(pentapeptide) pyrophosphoryl-undecaprenol N-acetylglucosamine transferase
VLHIAGNASELSASDRPGYTIINYCDRMELALAAADFAIARSGSVTVCEFAAVGLPAVFVPLPIGNGEQRLNAAGAVAAGGALLVDNADFTPAWISTNLLPVLADRSAVIRFGQGILSTGHRGGTDRMVALVQGAAK